LRSRRLSSHQQYVDGILKGQRTILAQAITLIEARARLTASWLSASSKTAFPTVAIPFASASRAFLARARAV